MHSNIWPLQSELDDFYGLPSKIEPHLISQRFPFRSARRPSPVTYDGQSVSHYRIHEKCAPSIARVLFQVFAEYEKRHGASATLSVMALDGVLTYDGSYCDRNMRGSSHKSTHAYGCAIDFDAEHNPRGKRGRFSDASILVQAFKAEGWGWGGDWHGATCDPMHFQAARAM